MIVAAVGFAAAAVFAALSGLHVYWALGGRVGSMAVIPTDDGRPTLSPSSAATWAVALLLALSALLLVGGVLDWSPVVVFRLGCAGVSAALIARAIGDRKYIGLLKRVRDTDFARLDTRLFSPLCLALGGAAAIVALLG